MSIYLPLASKRLLLNVAERFQPFSTPPGAPRTHCHKPTSLYKKNKTFVDHVELFSASSQPPSPLLTKKKSHASSMYNPKCLVSAPRDRDFTPQAGNLTPLTCLVELRVKLASPVYLPPSRKPKKKKPMFRDKRLTINQEFEHPAALLPPPRRLVVASHNAAPYP